MCVDITMPQLQSWCDVTVTSSHCSGVLQLLLLLP
jgi:hypothetical protein